MFVRTEDSHPRSIAKAVSWRITGSVDTFVLSLPLHGERQTRRVDCHRRNGHEDAAVLSPRKSLVCYSLESARAICRWTELILSHCQSSPVKCPVAGRSPNGGRTRKRSVKMPRISSSRSVIRPRAYPVRSLRLCRTEFSVHTGLGLYHLYQKDAVRKSSVIRRTAKASRSEIESFDRSRGRRNHLHKYIRFCHRQRTALSATDKRRAICCGIELCTRGMSG
jgi:hypothetical protein